jgi:GNAT superfamily N-acetyltransferase
MDLTFSPVTADRWPALEDLFGRAGASNGCWCMYWRLGPRYRDRPREQNKRDLEQLTASDQPPGLLAFDGGVAVGWCELAPRHTLEWLASGRYFPPVDDLPVWSVPCFYVRRTHRGRGVMDALIEAATEVAASAGAPALEAYPVDTSVPGHTGNLFCGVASTFARHGFQVVARRQAYRPVMRKDLRMSEQAPAPGDREEPDVPDEAREAELMRQVLRMQQRHREGGVDPELDDGGQDPEPGESG